MLPSPIVRVCTRDDADELAQIGAATFLESYAGWLPGRDILAHCRLHHSPDAYASLLASAGTKAWVAEVKEAPVGYLMLTSPDFPTELVHAGDLELKRIYFFNRFHGSGLAGRMLSQALAYAKDGEAKRMLVGLHPENYRALAFYTRHGFSQIGTRRFKMGSSWYEDPVLACNL